MIPGTDNYLHDVSFNEILSVYYFDKEIKSIFLKATDKKYFSKSYY